MTDNIVTFKGKPKAEAPVCTCDPEDDIVLICVKCECKSWFLHEDGEVECTNCNNRTPVDEQLGGSAWRLKKGNPPADVPELVEANITVDIMPTHLAKEKTVRTITGYGEKLMFIAGYNTDGAGKAWFDFDTEDQRQWVLDRLDALKEWVTTRDVGSHTRVTVQADEEDDTPQAPEEK